MQTVDFEQAKKALVDPPAKRFHGQPTKVWGIRLLPDTLEALEYIATETGSSKSGVIRLAIADYLEKWADGTL